MPLQRGGPDFTFAGFVLLAVFGSLVLGENPLESPRPFESSDERTITYAESHSYDAMLWQDPFGFDLSEIRETGKDGAACHSQLNKKIKSLNDESVKILAPMVSTRLDSENEERRIRRRYALIAGLSESGYISKESNKLNYCFSQNSENEIYDVRWEHYIHVSSQDKEPDFQKEKPDILIVWLNNSAFATNLYKNIQNLLTPNHYSKLDYIESNALAKANKDLKKIALDFNILGPDNSDTLKKFISQYRKLTGNLDFSTLGPDNSETQKKLSLNILN